MRTKLQVIFILLFALTVFGKYPPDTTFADKLFELGLFDDARIEYERQSNGIWGRDRFLIAVCYLKVNNLDQSLNLFSIFIDSTSDYNIASEALLYCFDIELRRGNIESATTYVQRGVDSGLIEPDDEPFSEIVAVAEGDWTDIAIEPPRKKSPVLANMFSIMLPGSGQIYAGRPWEGFRSAGVNSFLWYITISGLAQGYYPRAITVFYLFGHRYWLGGADKAGLIATGFTETEKKRAYSELAEKLR